MTTDAQRGVTIAGAPMPPRWFDPRQTERKESEETRALCAGVHSTSDTRSFRPFVAAAAAAAADRDEIK